MPDRRVGSAVVDFIGRTSRFTTATDRARRGLRNYANGVNRANSASRRFTRTTRQTSAALTRLQQAAVGAFAGIGLRYVAGQIIGISDAYENLNNRLRLVTRDEENLTNIRQRLLNVATPQTLSLIHI